MRDNTKLLPAAPLTMDLPWGDGGRPSRSRKRRKGSRGSASQEEDGTRWDEAQRSRSACGERSAAASCLRVQSRRAHEPAHRNRPAGSLITVAPPLNLPCRLIYYGVGALTGAVLLRAVRRQLCRIPIIGVIATPFLGERARPPRGSSTRLAANRQQAEGGCTVLVRQWHPGPQAPRMHARARSCAACSPSTAHESRRLAYAATAGAPCSPPPSSQRWCRARCWARWRAPLWCTLLSRATWVRCGASCCHQ